MTDIAAIVHSLGGMAQKQQLVRRGARDLDLTRSVRNGEVVRARQGWYTTLPESDPRVRAVRVGGRLTGISAIKAAGGWVLGDHPLHVAVKNNAARFRNQWNRHSKLSTLNTRGVILHWDDAEVAERGSATSVGLMDALERTVLDEPLEVAVAAIDWALRSGALDQFDFERLILRLPANFQFIRDWVDATCDSLPESLTRTRLRLRGHKVVSQVLLAVDKHIDLVVDDCIAIETDGDEFHRDTFESDRWKDLEIAIERYHGIRPSARAVFHSWDVVELAVETALSLHKPLVAFGNSGVRIPSRKQKRRNSALARASGSRSPEFPKVPARGGADASARAGSRTSTRGPGRGEIGPWPGTRQQRGGPGTRL